jgi:hypothetical protein
MRTPLFGLMLLLGIGSCTAPAMDREAAVAPKEPSPYSS